MEIRAVFQRVFKDYGIIFVLGGLIIFFTFASNDFNFVRGSNLLDIMRQVSFTGIVAVGLTFCLLTGGIDLSVGSNVALGIIVAALFMEAAPIPFVDGGFNANPLVGSIIGLCATLLVGLMNGALINIINIPPLITTLATMEIVRGLVYTITGAIPVREGFTPAFRFLGAGSIGPIPVPVIMMAIVFVVGGIVLSKTVYGRHIYCVGGNPEVARLSGINVKKIRYSVFMISGILAGFAGLLLLGRMGSGQPKAAYGYEFEVITACVLGGVSIAGGEGKLWRVLFGVIIMGVLFNGLIQIGLNEFIQMMVKGGVLLIAVGLDMVSQYKKRNLVELKLEIAKKEGITSEK